MSTTSLRLAKACRRRARKGAKPREGRVLVGWLWADPKHHRAVLSSLGLSVRWWVLWYPKRNRRRKSISQFGYFLVACSFLKDLERTTFGRCCMVVWKGLYQKSSWSFSILARFLNIVGCFLVFYFEVEALYLKRLLRREKNSRPGEKPACCKAPAPGLIFSRSPCPSFRRPLGISSKRPKKQSSPKGPLVPPEKGFNP